MIYQLITNGENILENFNLYLGIENLHSLFSNDIKTSVPVLKNYSDEDQLYLTKLKNILDKEAEYDLIFSSVPKGFEVEKFVLKNLLNENELFSKKEGITEPRLPKTLPYLTTENLICFFNPL